MPRILSMAKDNAVFIYDCITTSFTRKKSSQYINLTICLRSYAQVVLAFHVDGIPIINEGLKK